MPNTTRQTTFYTFSAVMEGDGECGGKIQRYHGCDGVRHADCVCELILDEVGEVEFAFHLRDELIGSCDQSCSGNPHPMDKGFFTAKV